LLPPSFLFELAFNDISKDDEVNLPGIETRDRGLSVECIPLFMQKMGVVCERFNVV
jgi:hypothetical protein